MALACKVYAQRGPLVEYKQEAFRFVRGLAAAD